VLAPSIVVLEPFDVILVVLAESDFEASDASVWWCAETVPHVSGDDHLVALPSDSRESPCLLGCFSNLHTQPIVDRHQELVPPLVSLQAHALPGVKIENPDRTHVLLDENVHIAPRSMQSFWFRKIVREPASPVGPRPREIHMVTKNFAIVEL
jgi:hypothetical protein